MPSGRTHDRITWLAAPPTFGVCWHYSGLLAETLVLSAAFVFAGLMFSGDLDLPSVQYRRWGPLRWIWKPYQRLVPHRSALSHGILLGPLVRLAYLSLVVGLVAALVLTWRHAQGQGPAPEAVAAAALAVRLEPGEWRYIAYALGGLWLGGASHTLADQVGSAWKRFRRPRGARKRRR